MDGRGKIKTNKKTGQRLLLKTNRGLVSILYVLDDNDNKIPETNKRGRILLDINGNTRYKMAICHNKNLI